MLRITKKNGVIENFDKLKVESAVELASMKVNNNKQYSRELGTNISEIINNKFVDSDLETIQSKVIQKDVESLLMKLDEDVAISYIEYRNKQDIARKGLTDITTSVKKVIERDARTVNENANKDSNKYPVIRDLTVGGVAKSVALKEMLPKRVVNAHIKGDIHFHDLDYSPFLPMNNCCLINFEEMFKNGTQIGNAKIDTPKSIQTATALTAQIVANVTSVQYGGVSFDRIDEVLAPYVEMNYKKHLLTAEKWIEDKSKHEEFAKEKTKKDTFDSFQSLEYELNTMFSSSGQTPFFTIGFGLGTSWASREIQRAIFENRLRGIGEKTAIFPKLVFTLKRGINLSPEDPNYDLKQLAMKCTSECMYPDILSYDKITEITGSFKAPMGCRSFLSSYKDENGEEMTAGRFNIGVTTINLPRIAVQSKGNKKRFWSILEKRLDIIKEAFEFRINRMKDAKPINAPILYQHGAFARLPKDGNVWDLMKNKRASISLGYIGLYEVGALFYGKHWQSNKEAKEFTLDVIKELDKKAKLWSDEYDIGASVYGTPSESLTDRFCQLDTERFGIIENITDKEYYTNSFHYDTREKINPFEKIDFEAPYVTYSPGGAISYVELTNAKQNLKALEQIWDYAYDKLGYFGVNTPIDKCFECGYRGDFTATDKGYECPQCKNTNPETTDVVKRLCGYLGNPLARPEVHGRHKEIQSRVKHDN